MSLAICGARCDGGGLAALTREVQRHLQPERTLLLDLEERGRGDCVPSDYDGANVYRCTFAGALPDRAVEWLCAEGVDTIVAFETFYDQKVLTAAHYNNIRTVMYAMPELSPWSHDPSLTRPRLFVAPTAWRLDTLPANTTVLPFPVARDRLPYQERKTVEHLYHVAGAAMLDRNGTDLLLAALPFVAATDLRLTVRSERMLEVPDTNVDVTVVSEPVIDYWEQYPTDIDLLVLPRRYGGLSLPVAECASLGVPALMLQTDPYASELFVHTVPSTGSRDYNMKGGYTPVHQADPRAIASAIDFLVEHEEHNHAASLAADDWAERHSWSGPLGSRWCGLLDCERDVSPSL